MAVRLPDENSYQVSYGVPFSTEPAMHADLGQSPASDPDVVIIGGGPAGLQAALVLGRARRRVLVVDADEPSHYASAAVHGVLGFENVPPRELRQRAWRELAEFDVTHISGRVVSASATQEPSFAISLDDGSRIEARRLLLAGGVRYAPSTDAKGVQELWGERVFHCPFCHGWEVRGKRIAVIGANTQQLEHVSKLLTMWTDDVVAISDPVLRVVVREDDALDIHHERGVETVDAALCPPRFEQADYLPEQLGVVRVANEPMLPEPLQIEVDESGATSVQGVFACGDLAVGMPSASFAIASGARAAFGIVRSFL